MYKYFCKLSLGLKFGDVYFGFTAYTMPMSKASKIWNKLSRSLSLIYDDLRQTSSLFASESAFYLYANTCGKIYIERTQGCKFMNLRTHTQIYKTRIQPSDMISPGRTN